MVRNTIPSSLYGEISTREFLETYWQKKPLLVRNAWPGFNSPIDVEIARTLACREDADSRLILEKGGEYAWEALFGPFMDEDLEDLPASHWTLLVHETERLVPEVSRLFDAVPFLPNWRIDDIMVSYAADQGGVGAHIDQYDVFLLQGAGQRIWQIDERPITEEILIPDMDVRMLADFQPTHEWLLSTGDLLYLPPCIAHNGIAVGTSITYSIGCRAPSSTNLVGAFLEDWLGSDPAGQSLPHNLSHDEGNHQGLLHTSVKSFAAQSLQSVLDDGPSFEKWLGRYLSRPSRGHAPTPREEPIGKESLVDGLRSGGILRTAVPSQFLYDQFENGELILYAGGEEHPVSDASAEELAALTSRTGMRFEDCSFLEAKDDFVSLLVSLVNDGYVRLETED